jgi:hypothetical protein
VRLEAHQRPSYAVLRHVQPPTGSSSILEQLRDIEALVRAGLAVNRTD